MHRGAPAGLVVAAALAALLPSSGARADEPERLKSAAEEFDVGRRAYLAGQYVEAAVHFENAYHDAPRPEPLRSAIRARRAAHDDARAATLASLAAVRYATDTQTMDLANDTLSELSPRLLGVNLACDPDCGVAVDGRVVSLVEGKGIVFYAAPGKHEVLVTWPGDRTRRVTVEGGPNSVRDLTLHAPPLPPVTAAPPSSTRTSVAAPPPPPATKPFGPAVFAVGAGLTAIGIGATILSGVDAQNDPGKDAVLRDCVGLGDACATYQRGKSAELRTNVLLAGTGVVGAATAVIGVFFTQWTKPRTTGAASAIAPYASMDAPGMRGAYVMGVHGSW